MTAAAVSLLVAFALLLTWMAIFEYRLARLLDLAEATCDQADRTLGFITEKAAPAVDRIATIAPELADALVTHRSVLATPQQPATEPARPRPSPGPRTVPENHAIRAGQRQAEEHANGVDDPFLVAYRAELDRQMTEWRSSREEAK